MVASALVSEAGKADWKLWAWMSSARDGLRVVRKVGTQAFVQTSVLVGISPRLVYCSGELSLCPRVRVREGMSQSGPQAFKN